MHLPVSSLVLRCYKVGPVADSVKVAFASSILFGLLHGGIHHIWLQGVSGVLYATVYLKCGGMRNETGKDMKAFSASTIVHAAHNMILIFIYK